MQPVIAQGTRLLPTEADTAAAGRALASVLASGGVVFLEGTLGAGKTFLARALLQGLGHSGSVKSPTYTLVEPYELPVCTVYHFDLYRLSDPEELEFMGIRDYFAPGHLCLVEWPSRGAGVLPAPDVSIELTPLAQGRSLQAKGYSSLGQQAVEAILGW